MKTILKTNRATIKNSPTPRSNKKTTVRNKRERRSDTGTSLTTARTTTKIIQIIYEKKEGNPETKTQLEIWPEEAEIIILQIPMISILLKRNQNLLQRDKRPINVLRILTISHLHLLLRLLSLLTPIVFFLAPRVIVY